MESTPTIAETADDKSYDLFGELLVSRGLLSKEDLERAMQTQQDKGGRLGEVLTHMGLLDDEAITQALAEHLSLDYISLEDKDPEEVIDISVARGLPESIATRFSVVALSQDGKKIVVGMADPLNVIAIDTVTLKLRRPVKPVVCSRKGIKRAIDLIYHGSDVEEQHLRDLVEHEEDIESGPDLDKQIEDITEADVGSEADAAKPPVIRFVDLLLAQAAKSRASDIHIEPQERSMMVRMRIDGILRNMVPPAKKMQTAVIARIKILAGMDIAERRLPQDGRFRVKASGRPIDVRVSVLPTIYGEKVVMRILDASAVNHDLDQLGFEPERLQEFKEMLERPHGIMIVTGPTGSGKSTTLYSALTYVKDPAKNISTVEDPVEYRLEGINQTQVKSEIKLDFAKCLRALLRQDPDIILIGEIRDKETAEIAIKASLTGHLVLSTFHTNDAASAVSRLVYMGVERYLLASSLNMVVAQRLVRRICDNCKEPAEVQPQVLQRLNVDSERASKTTFYEGKGCNTCGGTGYRGRLPIFEFLPVDGDVAEGIVSGVSENEIRNMVRERGYGSLLSDGVNKMLAGLTTAEEVLRVTFTGNK